MVEEKQSMSSEPNGKKEIRIMNEYFCNDCAIKDKIIEKAIISFIAYHENKNVMLP